MTHSLTALGYMGRWMGRHDVNAGEFTSDVLDVFIADHIDRYRTFALEGRDPLLGYSRSVGLTAAEPIRRCSSLDGFLGEYRNWLAGERALSPDIVRGYTRLAHRFLAKRVPAEDELGSSVSPAPT